jgi:hypothetical protein
MCQTCETTLALSLEQWTLSIFFTHIYHPCTFIGWTWTMITSTTFILDIHYFPPFYCLLSFRVKISGDRILVIHQ